MARRKPFDIFVGDFANTWRHYFIQGILFIVFGATIFIIPKLLVTLAASFFVLTGLMLIGLAWSVRSFRGRYDIYERNPY